MGVNSLPRTVTRQRRGCDLNPGPSAPESSTLTTRLPEPPQTGGDKYIDRYLPAAEFNSGRRHVVVRGTRIDADSLLNYHFVHILRRRPNRLLKLQATHLNPICIYFLNFPLAIRRSVIFRFS